MKIRHKFHVQDQTTLCLESTVKSIIYKFPQYIVTMATLTLFSNPLESVPVTQYILSVNLTLTGGSCPTSTQLDSALSTWFSAQVHSAYTCIKNGTCSFDTGSGCGGGSGGVVYSFTLLQTKNLESNCELLIFHLS